ncbi:MAG: MFS transporter, partial [Dehalococcoidia bacterium]
MAEKVRISHTGAILATAFVILFFNTGSRFAFGVLLKPMQTDLHWSRSSLSLAATLFMFLSSLAMPAAGRIADRYGFRLVLSIATILVALGLGSIGWVDSKWQLFLLYGVVFALGSGGTSVSLVSVLVSRWFTKGRGMANGVAIAGGAVGQLVVISILSSFLLGLGWRPSYRILGLATLALTLPMVLLIVRSKPSEDTSTPPKEESRATTTLAKHANGPIEPYGTGSLGPALTSRRFLLLAVTYTICGFQDWLVGTHVVAFATDEGIGTVLAGNLLALMGVMGMVGVLLAGYLSDALGPSRPTYWSFILRIAIFSLVMGSTSAPAILTFALLYGFTFLMTAPLIPVFVARYFGVR